MLIAFFTDFLMSFYVYPTSLMNYQYANHSFLVIDWSLFKSIYAKKDETEA